MRWPWVSRDSYDGAKRLAESERENARHLRNEIVELTATYKRSLDTYREMLTEARADRLDITEKYHVLRTSGYAPIDPMNFPAIETPLSKLGDKTKAALASMARGMARINRSAMEAAALAMYAQGIEDEAIAHAVRNGESLRKLG